MKTKMPQRCRSSRSAPGTRRRHRHSLLRIGRGGGIHHSSFITHHSKASDPARDPPSFAGSVRAPDLRRSRGRFLSFVPLRLRVPWAGGSRKRMNHRDTETRRKKGWEGRQPASRVPACTLSLRVATHADESRGNPGKVPSPSCLPTLPCASAPLRLRVPWAGG